MFLLSISMYSDSIQIVGNSKDKWAIAQLGKNLETIEDFHEIFISNISSEEGYYNFVLNISLKDVNIDEEESIEEETEGGRKLTKNEKNTINYIRDNCCTYVSL